MPRKSKIDKIPFDKNGNLAEFFSAKWAASGEYIWKDNVPFEGTMKVMDFQRGRSAAHFIVMDCESFKKYTMFLADLRDCIEHTVVDHGKITGKWIFCKRGDYYGIKYYEA